MGKSGKKVMGIRSSIPNGIAQLLFLIKINHMVLPIGSKLHLPHQIFTECKM